MEVSFGALCLGLRASEGVLNKNSVEDHTSDAFKYIALLKVGDQVSRKEENLRKNKGRRKERQGPFFTVPTLATGRTSAGGAIGLSPPCLVFELAARPVDTAEVEEAGDKFKIEGA